MVAFRLRRDRSARSSPGGLRTRLVLGAVRPLLRPDDDVRLWAHVQTPDGRHHGILTLTTVRAVVRWTPRDLADTALRWDELRVWRLTDMRSRRGPMLSVVAASESVEMRLPLSSKGRARTASAVVHEVAQRAPAEAAELEGGPLGPDFRLEPLRRGWRGHTRRVVVTVLGIVVILVGLLFASPFFPGPGLLTILAGLAILATEYDWARDAHHWLRHKAEQVLAMLRERRQRRRERRRAASRSTVTELRSHGAAPASTPDGESGLDREVAAPDH